MSRVTVRDVLLEQFRRDLKKLGAKEIARRLGCSVAYVNFLSKGDDRRKVSLEHLDQIALGDEGGEHLLSGLLRKLVITASAMEVDRLLPEHQINEADHEKSDLE